jgi:GMP synthase (glutamine-hydrolysing)
MQKMLVLDLGGSYGQMLARRVRECHVFSDVHPADKMDMDKIRAFAPAGILLVGGGQERAAIDPQILSLGVPVLGIGSGCLAMVEALGGSVARGQKLCGRTLTNLSEDAVLFSGMPPITIGWMDQEEYITALPEGFVATASTKEHPIVAFSDPGRQLYGTMFHPEAGHTEGGLRMLERFLKEICGAADEWTMDNILRMAVDQARERIGDRKVLMALSGGVDSSVAAALLSRAVGSQLTCLFVDHGMLRKGEGDEVEGIFTRIDTHFIRVNAVERFQQALEGVTDPEQKRRIIADEFVKVFQEEARKLGGVDFLAQGNIYPDILEAGQGYADVIKSHREMRDLPDHIEFKELIEPLRYLFKDEVRALGRTMGLPEFLVARQPFPGPGLAIRIMGTITPEKLELLRDADHIFTSELEKAHVNQHIAQYFAVLTDTQLYGSLDGRHPGGYTLALRAVTTDDFATAKWARIPYELLDKISGQIMREVPGISRVVYDITNKPPATIEWA